MLRCVPLASSLSGRRSAPNYHSAAPSRANCQPARIFQATRGIGASALPILGSISQPSTASPLYNSRLGRTALTESFIRRYSDKPRRRIDPKRRAIWLYKKEEKRQKRMQQKANKPLFVPDADLSNIIGIRTVEILKLLIRNGITPRHSSEYLKNDVVDEIIYFYGRIPDRSKSSNLDIYPRKLPESREGLPSRPPIVVVMGHVDHGKTTLIDGLRNSELAKAEFGGITQKIGAFTVESDQGKITVIDTPGHAAFEAMRQRGAKAADVAILVVSVDDGVQDQTLQAIKYITEAEISMVVCITKIDKRGHDPQKVKLQLNTYGIQLEEFGGDIPVVEVSAQEEIGMEELVETVLTVAGQLDLRTEDTGPGEAVILDGRREEWRGFVTTAIVKVGTLKKGDNFVAGLACGTIKNLVDANGKVIPEAKPGMPVEISGWESLPNPGDYLIACENEAKAKSVSDYRKYINVDQVSKAGSIKERKQELDNREREKEERLKAIELGIDPDEFVDQQRMSREATQPKEIPIIIKCDNLGSAEAIKESLKDFPATEVALRVVRTEVSGISEQDVKEIELFDNPPVILGFNVNMPSKVKELAAACNVHVNSFKIIYGAVDWLKVIVSKRLTPTTKMSVTAKAEVLQIFSIRDGKKHTVVAGSKILNGTFKRGKVSQVLRNGKVIYEGQIRSLKHVKQDVRQIEVGKECGISFDEDFEDIIAGDIIQNIEREAIGRTIKLTSEEKAKQPKIKYGLK